MNDAAEQTFPCKEAGCTATVTYTREVVPVYRDAAVDKRPSPSGRIIRVYLTCSAKDKHEHEYRVRV